MILSISFSAFSECIIGLILSTFVEIPRFLVARSEALFLESSPLSYFYTVLRSRKAVTLL